MSKPSSGQWLVLAYMAGILAVVNGWAMVWLWSWFVAPVFSVLTPSFPHMIGLSMTIRFVVHGYKNTDTKDLVMWDYFELLIKEIVFVLLTVGLGWLIYQFSGGG